MPPFFCHCTAWRHTHLFRLDFIMRHRYPEGSIGVDSPFNPTSEVHAERRSLREAKEVRDILARRLYKLKPTAVSNINLPKPGVAGLNCHKKKNKPPSPSSSASPITSGGLLRQSCRAMETPRRNSWKTARSVRVQSLAAPRPPRARPRSVQRVWRCGYCDWRRWRRWRWWWQRYPGCNMRADRGEWRGAFHAG